MKILFAKIADNSTEYAMFGFLYQSHALIRTARSSVLLAHIFRPRSMPVFLGNKIGVQTQFRGEQLVREYRSA